MLAICAWAVRLVLAVRPAVHGLVLLLIAAALPAHAHKPSDSYLALNVSGDKVDGQWDIALRDLDFAIGLDGNGDGLLTWDEVRTRHADIASYALGRLDLSTEKGTCAIAVKDQQVDNHTDGAYTVLRFQADCPKPINPLNIGYRLFADVDPQHKGLARISHNGDTRTAIFSPERPRQALQLSNPGRLGQFADYVKHGVWHIWIGFDHILFLLSLLLPAVLMPASRLPATSMKYSFMDVLKVVTSFTLAHSLTLTLASLHVLSLPSRWVEAAIAASVAAAALNNIWPLFRGRRALAAFAFGLVHGFGFAGVLADLGLPQGALLLSLFGFNVGVELGQLAIVAAFLPAAFVVRGTWFYRQLFSGGSALIVLVAAVWFVERALDLKLLPA